MTAHGAFRLIVYRDKLSDATHLALVRGPISPDTETLVRVHEPLSVMDLLDAHSRSHSWTIPGALRGDRRGRPRRDRAAAPAGERARSCARRAIADQPPVSPRSGSAQLRHRRADPADLNVGKMRLMARPRKMPSMTGYGLEVTGYVEPPQLAAPRDRRRRTRTPRHSRIDAVKRIAPQRRPATAAASASCCRASMPRSASGCWRARCARCRRPASPSDDILVVTVPGALEAPLALQRLAQSGEYDALVALGAVIRGETYHFEIVANESAAGDRERAARVRHPDRQRHPHDQYRRAGAGSRRRQGVRGRAGGAGSRQPAGRDR